MSTVSQQGLPNCPSASVELFGTTASGQPVQRIKLQCKEGDLVTGVSVLTYGATVQEIIVPDKAGKLGDVCLGFDDLAGYVGPTNFCFGGTPGRYANRIKSGKFTLDGKEVQATANWTGPSGAKHLLHGGGTGFQSRVWDVLKGPWIDDAGAHVTLGIESADGDEGFPGKLSAEATFSWCTAGKAQTLTIRWKANTSAPTVVNLTSHAYFNLGGVDKMEPIIDSHTLTLNCDKWTEVDDDAIPTGKLPDVEGTCMDFRKPKKVGEQIQGMQFGGYDHNFVVAGTPEGPGKDRLVARMECSTSGRLMECRSTQPGVQLFISQIPELFDKVTTGKFGVVFPLHCGFCLETQHFPDSPNHPSFPSTRLDVGQDYDETCSYIFSTA